MNFRNATIRLSMACIALTVFARHAGAQDQAVFNQYISTQGVLNPAYNGSRDVKSAMGLFRSQWLGIEGAPFTGAINAHGQVDKLKDLGVGVTIINDHAGFTNNFEFYAAGSYRLALDKKHDLRLGLQMGLKNIVYNANRAVTADYGDPVFDGRISKFGFNFGFGAFFKNNAGTYFAGLSIPRFFSNRYNSDRQEIRNTVSFRNIHTYVYGGYVFSVDDYKIRPTALFRIVPGSPLQVELAGSMLFMDRLWVGLSYRTVAEIVLFGDFQINKSWAVTYSFDFPFNDLRKYTVAGSHEIGVRYDFTLKRRPGMRSIRYF